ncbi:hypothetical protein [Chitinophaga filiformis]|uniref:Uncharacterized protein n=1 Tax=Chitinophaga filiformis TaxID=104663 RepID=A0A1G7MQG8_CHIFI|nr:hypothetical protein [Chitinophaga filiformis]SDF63359.1 hypothetical protein SAMN04488121_102509 [Chitinophaga filiformis]
MAIVKNKMLDISGSLGGFSFYQRKDSDKTILRTKGGATRKMIEKSPKFALTRLNNNEFGDAARGGCSIRLAIFHIRHLADYNFTPPMNALCRSIMKMDTEGALGTRRAEFSKYHHLLDGFNLNRRYPFNNVVKPPIYCTIDRDTATATIQLPELTPGINLSLPWQYPMYRIVLSIGILDDGGVDRDYAASRPLLINQPFTTPWRLAAQAYKGETIVLQPDTAKKLDNDETLVVSIGIEMGTLISDAVIERVKYAGSGKILITG